MRVALYVRVSTQEQAREGYSIGEQIERLQKYADAMGWIVFKVYTDAGFTGANTDRPALKDLIKDVKNGKVEKVVVYKLDRLSRSQLDTLYLIEKVFLANNTDFVSMNENFDTSTPFGRAMIGILAVFAQLEREQIKERMTMGKDARAKEGKWKGGKCPIGYKYVDGELVVDEFTAMQVKELFKVFTEGMPLRTIERVFNEKGYKNQYGKSWSPRQMRRTLDTKIYIGLIKHKDTWIQGTHEPIIDEETFELAGKVLHERQRVFAESGVKGGIANQSTYLGGLLHCTHCGGRYSKYRTGSSQSKIYCNYGCYSRHKKVKNMIKDPNCKNKSYRVEELDNIIIDEIKKLAIDPSYIHEIKTHHQQTDEIIQKTNIIQEKIADLENQISRFLDLYGKGRFTFEQLDKQIIPLEEQKNKLNEELESLADEETESMSEDEAIEIIESFEEALERGNFDEIRGIITSLINHIDIDNDDITIYWNFM